MHIFKTIKCATVYQTFQRFFAYGSKVYSFYKIINILKMPMLIPFFYNVFYCRISGSFSAAESKSNFPFIIYSKTIMGFIDVRSKYC